MKYKIVLENKKYCVDVSDSSVSCDAEAEKENRTIGNEKKTEVFDELPDFDFFEEEEVETICSPMQGKILSIVVKNGQVVRKGEKIASLESMKMEISVKSNIDGFIRNINIEEGEFVKNNQELFVVKKEV